MKLSIGFSPCPNDTFIFDAMIHGKIDTEGLDFEVVIADVEELNRRAFANELHVSKLSYHAFAWMTKHYALLPSGSALGNNCGPLLISKKALSPDELSASRIAIPGKYTTANLLLSLALPNAKNKVEVLFSAIEDSLINGQVDAGLIIHENRFTYQSKGLIKIMDLGEFWEETTHLPIPLGGIVIQRSLPLPIQHTLSNVLRRSVEFARKNPSESLDFIKCHAQEMDVIVMHQHIDLYVNDYTVDLGLTGRKAVNTLFQEAAAKKLIPTYEGEILLN